MNPFSLSPPARMLTRLQTRSGLTRAFKRLRSPRRIVLSIIGLVLAIIWVGQAVAGILLRESADPEKLRLWIPLSLACYTVWNIVKIAFRKPETPFAWTPAEEELLLAAPLPRAELIRFRLAATVRAALLKSCIFSLVMIPDLNFIPFGFFGMLAGLLLIDLVRMLLEVITWGMKNRELWILRIVCGALLLAIGGSATFWVLGRFDASGIESMALIGFLRNLLEYGLTMSQTEIGKIILFPFRTVADFILADRLIWAMPTCLVGIFGLAYTLIRCDKIFHQRRCQLERENLPLNRARSTKKQQQDATIRSRKKPAHLGGLGSLGWRQMLGAKTYRSQLLFAMLVPLILSCVPAMSGANGLLMVMNVAGGLAFYSFLLLPSSMPFDMRRDLKRVTVLKSLPISPMRLVLGQITAPFVLTTAFQIFALGLTMCINPFHIAYFFIAMALLIPFNLFIFGLENLLIMWYPYRLNQEGIQVFIRSILSFTAKGLFFAVAAAAILIWAYAAKHLGELWLPHSPRVGLSVVFSIGGFLGLFGLAATVVALLARSFERFDPSCDLAGLD